MQTENLAVSFILQTSKGIAPVPHMGSTITSDTCGLQSLKKINTNYQYSQRQLFSFFHFLRTISITDTQVHIS